MTVFRTTSRILAYAWASPNTLFGAVLGLAVLCTGGRLRLLSGTAEFSGGCIGRLIERLPPALRFSAITFGHVVLGSSEAVMPVVRAHERVHVRQYERWGVFFLPAYLLSSGWEAARGRRAYRDNYFEREAFGIDGKRPAQTCLPRRGLRPASSIEVATQADEGLTDS